MRECTYPLTGKACVARVYTDLAVIDIGQDGFVAIDIVPGLSFEELVKLSGVAMSRWPCKNRRLKKNLETIMDAFICDYVRTPIGRFGGSLLLGAG